jgi:hypothetical protein
MPDPTRPSPTQTIKVTGSDKMIAPRVVPKRGAKKVKAARLLTAKRLIIQNHTM